jgi:nitrogen fixation protein FixH
MKKFFTFVSAYRWPIMIVGFLTLSITANGILVYVATRPDVPRPIVDYYQKSLSWDADKAQLAASQQLGWDVKIQVPEGKQFAVSERRPVDVTVHDRDGKPVTGLTGRLFAMRPADGNLNGFSPLTELPHDPGSYRTLARLTATGVWEMSIDARQGETPFVYKTRVNVDGAAK